MDSIQQTIKSHAVVMFSASTCKYSLKAKRIFLGYDDLRDFKIVEIDQTEQEQEYRTILQEITGARTTPRIFISGKSIGGADDLEKIHHSGDLRGLLVQAGALPARSQEEDQKNTTKRNPLITVSSKRGYRDVCQDVAKVAPLFKYGVLHSYDLTNTLKSKGQDFEAQVSVFEVCNPGHAANVLKHDLSISSFLPCRLSVWFDEPAQVTKIQTIRPTSMIGLLGNDQFNATADQVEVELFSIMMKLA